MTFEQYAPMGLHVLIDLHGCDATLLSSAEPISILLATAAQKAGATVIAQHFHHFGEQQGVTGVLLLKESHMSIHTWPEHQYAAIDIFMCGQTEIDAAQSYLLEAFKPERHVCQRISRGTI